MDLGIKTMTLKFDDNQLGHLAPIQGDTKSRGFVIEMVSVDGEIVPADSLHECRLYGVNSNYPDKTFYTKAEVVDGKYKVYLSTDMVSKAGTLKIQIALYKGSEELIQSEVKEVEVSESMANGGSIGKDLVVDFTKLEKALERVDVQEKAYKDSLQKQEVIKADIDNKQKQVSTDTTAVKKIRTDMEGVMAAEASRVSAEKTRQSQESTRQKQEGIRENKFKEAEANRSKIFEEKENLRQSEETKRQSQESTRQSQESTRKSQEAQRVEAEKKRVSEENSRATSESKRNNQESTRQSNEDKRKSAESIRVNGESRRESQEITRQFQETQRVEAEKKRKSTFDGWDKTMQGVIPNATDDKAGVVKVKGTTQETEPYTVPSIGNLNKTFSYLTVAFGSFESSLGEINAELNGKADENHTHSISEVTNLQSELNKKQPTLSAGSNITISGSTISAKDTVYDDSSVRNLIGGKANANHSHSISDVSNLQTTLNGKSSSSHSHSISDVSGLQSALNGKASTGHTHTGMVTAVGSIKADNIAVISNGGSTSGIPNNTLIFELE